MRDTIIVEKLKGNDVVIGSKFYCGCCGNILGESKNKITFPFSVETFKNSLKNKTFDITPLGLYHKTCRHTMFSLAKGYEFINLETYIENVPQT